MCDEYGGGEPSRSALGIAASLTRRTPHPTATVAHLLLAAASAVLRMHVHLVVMHSAMWQRCGVRGAVSPACDAPFNSIDIGMCVEHVSKTVHTVQSCMGVATAGSQGQGRRWGVGSQSEHMSEVSTCRNAWRTALTGPTAVRRPRARQVPLSRLRPLSTMT